MDPVRFEFSIHDRYQFQLKFNFPLRKEEQNSRIRVETYLFLPASLGVNSDTYTRDYFYRDFSSLTRYGVPPLSLQLILDRTSEISPLSRLTQILDKIQRERGQLSSNNRHAAQYELRVLGCIVCDRIPEGVLELNERFAVPIGHSQWNKGWLGESCTIAGELFERVEAIQNRLREIKREYASKSQDRELIQAFEYIDETISIESQRAAAHVSAILDRARIHGAPLDVHEGTLNGPGLSKWLTAVYQKEESHRLQCGYPSALESVKSSAAENMNEHLIYRQELLRNYCHDALMLTTFIQQGSKSMQTLLNALAAMTAMLVFLVVMYLVQKKLPSDSLLYIALPVLAYAIKDRVKDALKLAFARRATGILRDREVELIDRRTDPLLVGKLYEVFNFVAFKNLPSEIRELRSRSAIAEHSDEGRPEQVLRHEKEMLLYVDRVFQRHRRVDNVCTKYRFSVRHMLFRMDEPVKPLHVLRESESDPAVMTPATVHARKVYHANLVLKISVKDHAGHWGTQLAKYRLILTRDGIVRYETQEQTLAPGIRSIHP